MQTKTYDLKKILQEFSLDELEYILFKEEEDFDSFLTISEVTPLPFPKPDFTKQKTDKKSGK
ncbi:MAG: hypothetical protein P8X42_01070 [Calditrichaceae bacterium]|jgi:hypothetical protein